MPLTTLSSSEALDNAKSSSVNSWPNRADSSNRVEPVCKPAFKTSFRLEQGDSVFTIGSCFARNVEAHLESLGFEVPMRKLEVVQDYSGPAEDNPNIFNNYAVPSIYNELEWALDQQRPFDPDTCLLEVTPGKFCDLHLTRLLKAVPLANALARRERIKSAIAKIRDCRVIIITLGLVEVWFDNNADRYLNIAPPKMACIRDPERFELRVMEHDEIVDYLRRTIRLIQNFCGGGAHVVITVSPVPLALTFTKEDVIIANAYSKSVLRAAVEKVRAEFDRLDYFPSYESVTLSERRMAWTEDLRHVTADVVKINVLRMVSAYLDGGDVQDRLVEAKSLEKRGDFASAIEIYREVLAVSKTSQAQVGYAGCLLRERKFQKAHEVLKDLVDDEEVGDRAVTLMAAALRHLDDADSYRKIEARLENIGTSESLRELVLGSFHFKDYDRVEAFCSRIRAARPRAPFALEYLARVRLARGDAHSAEQLLTEALAYNQAVPSLFALMGEVQFSLDKREDARRSFESALALNPRTRAALLGVQAVHETGEGRILQPQLSTG